MEDVITFRKNVSMTHSFRKMYTFGKIYFFSLNLFRRLSRVFFPSFSLSHLQCQCNEVERKVLLQKRWDDFWRSKVKREGWEKGEREAEEELEQDDEMGEKREKEERKKWCLFATFFSRNFLGEFWLCPLRISFRFALEGIPSENKIIVVRSIGCLHPQHTRKCIKSNWGRTDRQTDTPTNLCNGWWTLKPQKSLVLNFAKDT